MPTLFYVAVKLFSYVAWCWAGLWIWQTGASRIVKAVGLGVVRLVIGISLGVGIFLLLPVQPENLLWKYVAIYAPVRMIEWLLIVFIFGPKLDARTAPKSLLWCVGGIVVSFVADFASPEGVAGHFCIGRCLC